MTEILSKEKEFIKINQQLDKMALKAVTGQDLAAPKVDNRFYTFQKSKGPSTLLRKQGAGDGCSKALDLTNIREFKRIDVVETNNKQKESASTSGQYGQHTFSSNSTQNHSKLSKPSDINRCQQSSSRVSNSRVPPTNNSTFTIKYRNPKFLESPSLEVLVKEESTSLHSPTKCQRLASLNSMPTDDGISSGRCSQTSYHSMASKKNVSSEGLIKFLKSKIVILEEDHQRISQEMVKQRELFEKTLEHNKSLEQQRDQARSKNNSLTEHLGKCEKQLGEANKLLKERSIEQNSQNKELETTKREFKLLTQTNTNLEKRLFRANEDLENARKSLNEMKANEREQREIEKKEADMKEIQIKSLKKQRANLLNAYKKQLFLIDNLKRQNILLEQAKMLDIGEKEFAKVLDWDGKK